MTEVAALPASPFKGLAAFEDSELDALLFFGREQEREVLVANLIASRLTVLYGASGVGKSSLLAAAVVRDLRAAAPGAVVELHDTWSGEPGSVLDAVRDAPEAYVILDQFEEYFLYHGDNPDPGAMLHDLPELLRDSRVHVLISLREDSLARLDAFKARIPAVFANQIRLDHLDRTAARSAILGPVARWNELTGEAIEVEPALIEAVLEQVAAGRVEGRGHDVDRIEAPYLQLVLERIWHAERAAGSSVLRLETLRRLGGATTIVRDHLEGALAALGVGEQDVAASMFEHLVTPSGTKIAHRAPDLAEYASVPEADLRRVLEELTRARIVHAVDGSDRFEIFHDVLAEPIRDWRVRRRVERERAAAQRRQRRLYAVSVVSLVALAIVTALAVWAFSERSSARAQARQARARELQALALQQLPVDPNYSLRLALTSARLEPGRQAESVLRQTLTADRLRLVRHTNGPVRAVAVSPHGDLIAAAVRPGIILVLDARNRRLLRTLGPRGAVAGLDFQDDGRSLVTASPTGIAHVWDVGSGRLVGGGAEIAARLPDGHLRLVPLRGRLRRTVAHSRRLSVTPRGDLVAVSVTQRNGQVRPWIFDRRGRLLHVLPLKGVQDLTFSPDGRLLATEALQSQTMLWDPRSGARVRTFERDAKGGGYALAFSPDGTLLATGGADSAVRIWTVATGERTFFLFGHTNPVTAVAWSPDGRVVASASPDQHVLLWRVQDLVGVGSLAATLAGNRGKVDALSFTRDSNRLVTGGEDRTVRVWNAQPDQQLHLLARAPGAALAARWAGTTIAAAWSSGVVDAFDATTRRLTHELHGPGGRAVDALAISRDGSVIAAGAVDGTTRAWDARSGDELSTTTAGAAPVLSVAVAPGGDLVASGDSAGTVSVSEARGGAVLWSARQDGAVRDVEFSPDGGRLVSAGARGTTIWSARDGHRLRLLPSPDGDVAAAFSPDSSLVATAGSDSSGRIWFAKTGSLYRRLRRHTHALTDVAFSADGRLVATSSADSDVRVWGVRSGIGHVLQRTAFGPLRTVSFDPSGRWVVAAAPVSAIVWDAVAGGQLFYLRGHSDLLTDASFAPNGATVLSASKDGTVRTYTCEVCVDLDALVHLAQHRLAQTR